MEGEVKTYSTTPKLFSCGWLRCPFIGIVHTEGRAGWEVEGNSISSVLRKLGQVGCERPVELPSG